VVDGLWLVVGGWWLVVGGWWFSNNGIKPQTHPKGRVVKRVEP